MANYTDHDRSLALVGIYQVARLVYDIATTGKFNEDAYQTVINSVFNQNPSSTLDVYGDNLANLQLGVKTLISQMGLANAPETRNMEITRYALSVILLERSLMKTEDGLQKISRVLEVASSQREHFGATHENVIASLARAYTENLSNLSPRIMVRGQHHHLQNPSNASKIRALLLAGVRSAMLWRQVGGTRWGLFFRRKAYMQEVAKLYRPDNDQDNRFFRPKK